MLTKVYIKCFLSFRKSLATIINILDPEIIIMAGSVGQRWNIFKSEAEEAMKRYLSPIIKNINSSLCFRRRCTINRNWKVRIRLYE